MRIPVEVRLYVKRNDCLVMKSLEDKVYQIEKIVPGSHISNHIIKGILPDRIKLNLLNKGVKIITIGKDKTWARAPSCSTCNLLSMSDVLVLDAISLSQDEIVYRMIIPSALILRELLKKLNEMGFKPKVVGKKNILEEDKSKLTPRQLELIILAYKRGYFDVERKISLTDISKMLGIAPSSTQEILRRALKKIIAEYLVKLGNRVVDK